MNSTRLLLLALGLPLLSQGSEISLSLPTETGVYKPGPGVELVTAHCLMCHSTEYVSSQPPMPRKFWEASVKKMKDKFGAPTPDDQVSALINYLTDTYGLPDK